MPVTAQTIEAALKTQKELSELMIKWVELEDKGIKSWNELLKFYKLPYVLNPL